SAVSLRIRSWLPKRVAKAAPAFRRRNEAFHKITSWPRRPDVRAAKVFPRKSAAFRKIPSWLRMQDVRVAKAYPPRNAASHRTAFLQRRRDAKGANADHAESAWVAAHELDRINFKETGVATSKPQSAEARRPAGRGA